MNLLASARDTLTGWDPPSPAQDRMRQQFLSHLDQHPSGLWRDGPSAHLTASCFVLDPTARQILLTLHRRGRFWVQFGGHLEPGDPTLAAAAEREALEESGLPAVRLLPQARPRLVELHRHRLSAAFGPCQEHLDVAYLAVADPADRPVVSDESEDVGWWPVDDLPANVVPDLPGRLSSLARLSFPAPPAAGLTGTDATPSR
jgi:8-oxo-dGTP pyrophosphatase MutT (NUDIX family)